MSVFRQTGGGQDLVKRACELLVGALIGTLAAPIMLLTAVAVWLTMGKPLLFRQQRIGLGGRPFILCKWRTMTPAADVSTQPDGDDERTAAFGRWLRSTSLDELPSLWNVVIGDMSLIGPRPLLPEYLPLYSPRQARRHEVRPGLTGWAQVNGRNALDWKSRLEMDVWYVENQSLLLDLKILAMTVVKVLRREGIAQPGHATMTPFRGEH